MSSSSATGSIPVGPPPTMAMCKRSLILDSDVFGSDACSKRSRSRLRNAMASETFFMNNAFSATPGVLKVFGLHPGAKISTSYSTVKLSSFSSKLGSQIHVWDLRSMDVTLALR